MTEVVLYTSGSTDEPKTVNHSWDFIDQCIDTSINEIGLTDKDTVLDVFPGNTIAHYTITAMPARRAGSKLISAIFDPFRYIKLFNEHRPTYISLIPRHWELLKKTKGWDNLDMSCVNYMVTGSGPVPQIMIDDFINKGVTVVSNWYGMTEVPPPVFVGYNSESFDFTPKKEYSIEFSDEGECIINGMFTGDIFDLETKKFLKRRVQANGITWKTAS